MTVRSEEILVVEAARGEAVVAVRGDELVFSQGGNVVVLDAEDAEDAIDRVLDYVRRHVKRRRGEDEHDV